MVTPAAKREAVAHLRSAFEVSERRACSTRARGPHRRSRPPRHVRLRQRHRADQHGDPALVAGAAGRVALHRSGQATAERLRRVLHRAAGTRPCSARSITRGRLWRWKNDYNTVRPHSGVGNLPPAAYATLSVPATQRHGALRYTEGSAPHPVASPNQQGSNLGSSSKVSPF
jgi:Integrase core domain